MPEEMKYEQLKSRFHDDLDETVKRIRAKLVAAGIAPDGDVEVPSPEVYDKLIETDFDYYAKLCLRHMMESEGCFLGIDTDNLGEIDTIDFSPSYCEESIVIAKRDKDGNWV